MYAHYWLTFGALSILLVVPIATATAVTYMTCLALGEVSTLHGVCDGRIAWGTELQLWKRTQKSKFPNSVVHLTH